MCIPGAVCLFQRSAPALGTELGGFFVLYLLAAGASSSCAGARQLTVHQSGALEGIESAASVAARVLAGFM